MANPNPDTTGIEDCRANGPRTTKGLARQIRERTHDLSEQISEMIRISLDPMHKMQVTAIMWLADRAYGRVPEIAAFAELDETEARSAIKALTAPQLEALVESLLASSQAIQGATSEGKPAELLRKTSS